MEVKLTNSQPTLRHPERKDDEVLLNNFTLDDLTKWKELTYWKEYRVGLIAYDGVGKRITGKKPIFVKRSECEKQSTDSEFESIRQLMLYKLQNPDRTPDNTVDEDYGVLQDPQSITKE